MFGCGEAVVVVTVLELFDQDDDGVYIVGEHDELVSAAGADGETTHVIGVESSDGIYHGVELV